MEAREFKLDIERKEAAQLSQEEQRLKAIKKILVGNQIERLENRFRGLSRRVESTNGHLVSTVEDLNQEIKLLKAEMDLRASDKGDSAAIQKSLQELLEAQKGLTLDDPQVCQKLEQRIDQLENSIKTGASLDSESKDKIQSMASDIQDFKERLKATQERLGKMDVNANPEQKAKVNARLSRLEAKVQSLNPKKMEARLNKRQEEFEDGVQDLVERLAGRVNERFEFAGNSRKKLYDNQQAIAEDQKELKNRVDSIQDIIENDIMDFLSHGGNIDSAELEGQVKSLAGDLERKIYENNIRMEAKIDAMIDMTQRQMTRQMAPQEDPKMKAIKETLDE